MMFESLTILMAACWWILFPGAAIASRWPGPNPLSNAARVFLWSIASNILLLTVTALLRLPLLTYVALVTVASLVVLLKHRRQLTFRPLIVSSILFIGGLSVLTLPFIVWYDGLPTGDSQKAIFWAQSMNTHPGLPDYQQARTLLNRDPVDFYTPGLHALTAANMQLSSRPLFTVGLMAITASLVIATIAAAITQQLVTQSPPLTKWLSTRVIIWSSLLVTNGFLFTNTRFLRYLREPGYHYQNIFGELLLWGLLFLALQLVHRWHWQNVLLSVLIGLSLLLTHQFSSFLAPFVLLPLGVTLLWHHRTRLTRLREHPLLLSLVGSAAAANILGGFILNLHTKIPHIFTADPHLAVLLPTISQYPDRLGSSVLLATGIAGSLLLLFRTPRHNPAAKAFAVAVLVVLALSQGPRLFIDIPPVRALFYAVVPLSVAATYFALQLAARYAHLPSRIRQKSVFVLLVISVALALIPSAYATWQPTLSVRTNSTLTPALASLLSTLANDPTKGTILIDDYNQRRTSWALLSNRPVVARLAADLARQMQEATQSPTRYDLYLNQLEYEKIVALGSRSEIKPLLAKHNITTLTGITGSSNSSFAANPLLTPQAAAGGTTLYSVADDTTPTCRTIPADLHPWLLRNSTLANDIGDAEDTFKHLPASLRATRLSDPTTNQDCTVRISTAPIIPLTFNVGDFTQLLWDQEHTNRPDTALELLVSYIGTPTLRLETTTGFTAPLTSTTPLRLESQTVPIDQQGFITINLLNPTQAPIAIDLIALGVARTP